MPPPAVTPLPLIFGRLNLRLSSHGSQVRTAISPPCEDETIAAGMTLFSPSISFIHLRSCTLSKHCATASSENKQR